MDRRSFMAGLTALLGVAGVKPAEITRMLDEPMPEKVPEPVAKEPGKLIGDCVLRLGRETYILTDASVMDIRPLTHPMWTDRLTPKGYEMRCSLNSGVGPDVQDAFLLGESLDTVLRIHEHEFSGRARIGDMHVTLGRSHRVTELTLVSYGPVRHVRKY